MGRSQSPHSLRLEIIRGLIPVQKNMASTFHEDRCCLCCPGDPMEGTEWDTVGRREEERDLENGYLLMQKDRQQFEQCLVSPVLAQFCSP